MAENEQAVGPGQRQRGGVIFDVDGTLLDTNYLQIATRERRAPASLRS